MGFAVNECFCSACGSRLKHAVVTYDDWSLNTKLRSMTNHVTGERVELGRAEADVLAGLMSAGGETVSRSSLILSYRRSIEDVHDKSTDVIITRLRRKLEAVGLGYAIVTERGKGYAFAGSTSTSYKKSS